MFWVFLFLSLWGWRGNSIHWRLRILSEVRGPHSSSVAYLDFNIVKHFFWKPILS